MTTRKTVGLALGSGGVRGIAHIGVIKTLIKHGIPIDYLAGSSIGAWVAAHFSLFLDIEKTTEFTVGKKREKLMSFLELTRRGGLIRGIRLESFLENWFEGKNFSDLNIPVKVTGTDIVSGEKIIFSEGKLSKAVRASMAIPGLFKPVIHEGKAVVDGGLSDPVPVDLVKESGAEVVIAVNLDYFQSFITAPIEKIGLVSITSGAIEITKHYLSQFCCKQADFVIQPHLREYSRWRDYFMHNKDQQIIRLAEEETEKLIPEIKKKVFG